MAVDRAGGWNVYTLKSIDMDDWVIRHSEAMVDIDVSSSCLEISVQLDLAQQSLDIDHGIYICVSRVPYVIQQLESRYVTHALSYKYTC